MKKYLKNIVLKFMKLTLIFYKHDEKKIKTDENWYNCILFRVDVYFSEYNLAVEIDEKGHTD